MSISTRPANEVVLALPQQTMLRAFRPRMRLSWSGRLGLGIIVLFVLMALTANWVAPHDPNQLHPAAIQAPPSLRFPFGTDHLGRCMFSRVLFAARISLSAATLAAALIVAVGVVIGLASGYWGGLLDSIAMRLVDVLLAIPSLVLALAIVGTIGTGLSSVILGVVSVWWVSYARIVRSLVLSVRERAFIESARALGANHWRILVRHIWPQVLPPVLILLTLELGQLILALAGLNFLGLGVQPPTSEWGAMLNEGRPYLLTTPRLMLFPGGAIALVVLGFNLLGDGLRDALDPRLGRMVNR
jgi:peptide/nickel transport system permease protein